MKVFWAWQSDSDGKISRHFIRKAIEEAIALLKEDADIQEPSERDRLTDLHLDHDRKNVPGSPDLAVTILDKIKSSSVFIADVTPIARTDQGKEVMNPNVAIELGYALGTISDKNVLMILNESFGSREGLPFDIRHKAGPLIYNLPKDSEAQQRTTSRKKLVSELVQALKLFVVEPTITPKELHIEIEPHKSKGYFFDSGEVLAVSNPPSQQSINHTLQDGSYTYLRVFPKFKQEMPLDLRTMRLHISVPGAFSAHNSVDDESATCIRENSSGMISFRRGRIEDGSIESLTQCFRDNELWGVNSDVLNRGGGGKEYLNSSLVEANFKTGLNRYLNYLCESLHVSCPIIVEAGLIGVKNKIISTNGTVLDKNLKIARDEIVLRCELSAVDTIHINWFLVSLFEEIFKSAGRSRPINLNGFPG